MAGHLAILAMDSYNRGYDAGIKDGGDGDPDGLGEFGSQISNASVMAVQLPQGAQAAGFYAVGYHSLQYGTVISYRGTDNLTVFGSGESGSDIYNGWVQGAGEPTDQSQLALDFFQSVVAVRRVGANPPSRREGWVGTHPSTYPFAEK